MGPSANNALYLTTVPALPAVADVHTRELLVAVQAPAVAQGQLVETEHLIAAQDEERSRKWFRRELGTVTEAEDAAAAKRTAIIAHHVGLASTLGHGGHGGGGNGAPAWMADVIQNLAQVQAGVAQVQAGVAQVEAGVAQVEARVAQVEAVVEARAAQLQAGQRRLLYRQDNACRARFNQSRLSSASSDDLPLRPFVKELPGHGQMLDDFQGVVPDVAVGDQLPHPYPTTKRQALSLNNPDIAVICAWMHELHGLEGLTLRERRARMVDVLQFWR